MITYNKSPYGLALLFRVHGSACYRATIPGLISILFFLWIRTGWDSESLADRQVEHPYAIGVFVTSITFMLVFRLQQAYARYWEAASDTHHMMSKWMDATIHTAAYHMQCDHYKNIKPPSFYDYPELNTMFLTRDREDPVEESEGVSEKSERNLGVQGRAVVKSIEKVNLTDKHGKRKRHLSGGPLSSAGSSGMRNTIAKKNSQTGEYEQLSPTPLQGMGRMDGNWGPLFPDGKSTYFNPKDPTHKDPEGFASHQGGRTPVLFLQELAHLSSLMVAVALSTLRNDVEGAESPLDIYEPGSPWPAVDPDKAKDLSHLGRRRRMFQKFKTFVGFGRSPEERSRYNASRPLPVLGGVSEGEIRFLQMARGPYAKTQLTWMWFSEFITREHLAGTLGNVGPPIISRIIQFLGDGMIFYNHARKIMFIPFPFPHAQLSVIAVVVMIPAVALLMAQYTDDLWLGALLSFFTVTAISAIQEVARELENPFRNVPNELPLVTFQAQYNEALITMYAGFHPDFFWEEDAKSYEKTASTAEQTSDTSVSSNEPTTVPTSETSLTMEKQMEMLLAKIEEQARELERLGAAVNITEEKKVDASDRKNQ